MYTDVDFICVERQNQNIQSPFSENGRIKYFYVILDEKTRIGYLIFWCTETKKGGHISRVKIPQNAVNIKRSTDNLEEFSEIKFVNRKFKFWTYSPPIENCSQLIQRQLVFWCSPREKYPYLQWFWWNFEKWNKIFRIKNFRQYPLNQKKLRSGQPGTTKFSESKTTILKHFFWQLTPMENG